MPQGTHRQRSHACVAEYSQQSDAQRAPEHKSGDIAAACAERLPDAELLAPLRHRVRHHAENADGRRDERREGNAREPEGVEPPAGKHARQVLVQGTHITKGNHPRRP